jgi:hypothetical protein
VSWNSDDVFARNRGRAGYDQTHMFQMGFVYDLPMGQGREVANSGVARLNTQFRAEFFNFTNSPQFGGVSSSRTSNSFMQITSASGDRQIRFGLRFSF